MPHPRVLLCLDCDEQPSVFDAVVALDAGVDHLLRHGGVRPGDVEGLVHGAMFTRGPGELKNTAVFIGGGDVAAAEELARRAMACFFGPMRVSVLLDPNGSNTTAAAAVLAAARHVDLAAGAPVAVVGTGPVGQRAARLLADEGAHVRLASRTRRRADEVCERLAQVVDPQRVTPVGNDETPMAELLEGAAALIAAGPAGVEVVATEALGSADSLRVAVDLNAVPPAGVGGVEITDKAEERGGRLTYGAVGVGGAKMKVHKAAIARLFESNDVVLDAPEVFAIAKALEL